MKKLICFCLLGALSLPLHGIWAQAKAQEKPKAEEQAKRAIPIKVQIVFTEFDGDKKVSSMPYSFMTVADEKSVGATGPGTGIRAGVRIPIETDGKDQKTTYMDVGSNIDFNVKMEEDGRMRIHFVLERSALYPNKSPEGDRIVVTPNGQPLVLEFRTFQTLLLKDGQTSETTLSTDPLNGHTLRVAVTVNIQK